MNVPEKNAIAGWLMKRIRRESVLSMQDALMAGAQEAADVAQRMDERHRPSFLGQARHFFMNEAFHRALAAQGLSPHPLRGNQIVEGFAGELVLVRMNMRQGDKLAKCRSVTRRQRAAANGHLRRLAERELPGLLDSEDHELLGGTAIFLAEFPLGHRSLPLIRIGVPDEIMSRWLFLKGIDAFVACYDELDAEEQGVPAAQNDNARPTLKRQPKGGTVG
ncbi:MAG: hypothetical protein LBC63_03095 [Holophagales bacterium]|nr:hypothetical protein [Holophagales bacterium]